MPKKKTILIATLNWGLGHTTRCIPVINALLLNNFNVIIASDGASLVLLKKEFPNVSSVELPSYNISYPKNKKLYKFHFLVKTPHFIKVMKQEKNIVSKLVVKNQIDGIISDNRFGVFHEKIPSVYITHQLTVLSGSTTFLSSFMHQKIISKFKECWVPDMDTSNNLSGKLSDSTSLKIPIKYIGLLSRMKKEKLVLKYNILLLLSGPEPQRGIFEEMLLHLFKKEKRSVLLVRGVVEKEVVYTQKNNITIVNYLKTKTLEKAINQSKIIISRSGYTTIMDLAMMQKKAFFIPTPGQFEQEYLAKRMQKLKIAPTCSQEKFTLSKLKKIERYTGFVNTCTSPNLEELFALF